MSHTTPAPITTLSASMINKIAAGEVIERPASVVKELVENALDAGATRIDISLDEGGTSLIRIADNGSGIPAEELVLALSPHSTSKLATADDLFRISTFGFRGEALASVAEISQLTLRSRVAATSEGAAVTSNGGERSAVVPCGHPVGTTIEVRNLFFNTPVRRKYLRSTTTEMAHATEVLTRLALPHLNCHFTFTHNGRMLYDLPPHATFEDRIVALSGRDFAGQLLSVESVRGMTAVTGLVGKPSLSRPNNRFQYFFLNHRFIRDRALQHALGEAYRGLLGVGRFPVAWLHVTLPPDQYDVNVHPTKMEVRFLDGQRVYSHFLGTLRNLFLKSDLSLHPAAHSAEADYAREDVIHNENTASDPRFAMQPNIASRIVAPEDCVTVHPTSCHSRVLGGNLDNTPQADAIATFAQASHTALALAPRRVRGGDEVNREQIQARVEVREIAPREVTQQRPVIQCHQRYLIAETADGIAIIDQHALHERILFERLKTRIATGALESQRLLTPLPVDLSPVEHACVLEHSDFFASLGLGVEAFGGDTVLVTAYPVMLGRVAPRDLLLTVLAPLLERGHKMAPAEYLDDILHSMACHAAVKAGDAMTPDSMRELVALAAAQPQTSHCPHGRPTTLHFTCDELDQLFRRS